MLLSVLSWWVFVGKRRVDLEVDQLVPDRVRKLWNEWELRATVLLSLTTQILLVALGSRRRSFKNIWVRAIVWCAYLTADWAATVALGAISNKQGDSDSDVLIAFWAPFLLLHLGGPDTITAYALEDNQLWLRHLLGSIFQLGVALYVILTAWTGGWLSWLSLAILIVGALKCTERSWVLRSACRERFEAASNPAYQAMLAFDRTTKGDITLLVDSYNFFQAFSSLFVDSLNMELNFLKMCQQYFKEFEYKTAFDMVEIELAFAYDSFYTKAPIVYTTWGCITRILTFSLTVLVSVSFLFRQKQNVLHSSVNLIVTYTLLIGAVTLEFFGFVLLLSSEWTIVKLNNLKYSLFSKFETKYSICSVLFLIRKVLNGQRWSDSMGQYNMLSYCLKDRSCSIFFLTLFPKWLPGYESLETHIYTTHCSVSEDLKCLMFEHFKEKVSQFDKLEGMSELYEVRGECVIEKYEDAKELRWTSTKVSLDVSILIWHIVTDLCLYSYDDSEVYSKTNKHSRESKRLSEYMLYLLVTFPDMLPIQKENYDSWFPKVCSEVKSIIKQENKGGQDVHDLSRNKVTRMLLEEPSKYSMRSGGIGSKYMIRPAARVAKFMMEGRTRERMWEIICDVWIEMLGYVAIHCNGYYYHSQHLRRGGELVTHVWLLMAHLGITDKFLRSSGGPFADFLLQTPYLFD